MTITRPTAQLIMTAITTCSEDLWCSLRLLKRELGPGDFRKIRLEVCRAIYAMDCGIAAVIAHQFPDLAPDSVQFAKPF